VITKLIRKLLGRTAPATGGTAPQAAPLARTPAATATTAPAAAATAPAATASSGYAGRDPVVKRRSAGKPASRAKTGGAADSGRTAATANGPDAPVVIPADVHGIDPSLISRSAIRVTQGLQEAGFRAFIVGGAVRDLLLGVGPKDFDVATDATPDQVQKLFRRARVIGRRFQIVHVQFGQDLIEVSTFRAMVDPAAPDTPAAAASAPAEAARATALVDTRDDDDDDNDDQEDHGHAAAERRTDAGASGSTAPGSAGPGRGRGQRRRREDPDRRLHAVDASGRVLRDNVWGEQHEDARRRDFTINAMYYDPATQTVLDYHEGMADIRARLLRMIGDPLARYREDPVRMLRVVRFAAKLGFEIEPLTREPIAGCADLLNNVPAARVFDEMLKLLLSGNALACLKRLRAEGLHRDLLPLLDVAFEQPHGEKFITLSLTNTDIRVRSGKPVSPGFLFAALLWHQAQQRWQGHIAAGEFPIPALHMAMDEVLDTQTGKLAIQRRFVADMKEIWGMQPRLEKRSGRSALKLLEHPRFRAAYDFLLLRCEAGELDPTLGQWWTEFIEGDPEARETLLNMGSREPKPRARRRRRGGARQGGGANGGEGSAGPARESSGDD
jgi:poly(A) polymerase